MCFTPHRWDALILSVLWYRSSGAHGRALVSTTAYVKQLTVGAVGYAQWQVTNCEIALSPTSKIGISALNTLEQTHSQIYAAGPAINALTK
jgi:hypothetical protein